MTNNSAFSLFFSQISSCGRVILAVEAKALDSSLLRMFNRRNHAEFVAVLAQKTKELQSVAGDIRKSGLDVSKANGLHRMILELIDLANAVSVVCEGLNDKTLGRPYSHAQYRADLDMVEVKRASCNAAQARIFG